MTLTQKTFSPAMQRRLRQGAAEIPEAVIVRLAALLRPALIDTLVSRHPLPEMLRRDIAKRRRDRPDWWSCALFDRMR